MPDDETTFENLLSTGEAILVNAFAEHRGEGHLLLACHAAFPIVLTADLVYKIWQNFRSYTDEDGTAQEIPYVAVSDLLLSGLCKASGHRRFEMPANVRHTLLAALQDDLRFGKARLQELAAFLNHYIKDAYRDADPISQAIRKAQQLVVDAYLQPEKALQSLMDAFKEAEKSPAEQVRLSNLVERFDHQWSAKLLAEGHEKPAQTTTLLRYSQGLKSFHQHGDAHHAANLLGGVLQKGNSGLMLPLPGEVKSRVSAQMQAPQKGKLHALLVGIDEYHPKSEIQNLAGCKMDARKLADSLRAMHGLEQSPWSDLNIRFLFDQEATRENTERMLAEVLENAVTEDQVLLFFAGHARRDGAEGETELLCYDSGLPGQLNLTVTRFRNWVLSHAKQQPYITLVLDAQFSGSPNWLEPSNPRHVVFANSRVDEMGYEINGREGFFTKYFLDALGQGSGKAGNVALFVDTLVGMSEDKLSENQHPQFYATPNGADRPFLQGFELERELKRGLRLMGESFSDLQKRLNLSETATKAEWKVALVDALEAKSKADRPLFLFVFSDSDGELPGVQDEYEQVKDLVERMVFNTAIEAVFLQNPELEEVQQYFTAPTYRNRLHLFHFSGYEKEPRHSQLWKSGPATKKAMPKQQTSNIGSMSNIGDSFSDRPEKFGFVLADGLLDFFEFSPWLQYQENLRLAFFNTCHSNYMAEWAAQLGAWNSIGAQGVVGDAVATQFALQFYKSWMLEENLLSLAFENAAKAQPPQTNSGAHRAMYAPPEEEVQSSPFVLQSAGWLSTTWRGMQFGAYSFIQDTALRAVVLQYGTLNIDNKNERVRQKVQLSNQMAEIINSTVKDKRTLLNPQPSQGLLIGMVSSIREKPEAGMMQLLLDIAPMARHLFLKYILVEAAGILIEKGLCEWEQEPQLAAVMKTFEDGADEPLMALMGNVETYDWKEGVIKRIRSLAAKGELEEALSVFESLVNTHASRLINQKVALRFRYQDLITREKANTIANEDLMTKEYNQIVADLLKLLEQIEKSDPPRRVKK